MSNLIVILGPTGVGKTTVSLELAKLLHAPVIGADSRQMYRDIPVCTAAPSSEELRSVRHYFVANLELEEYYSAARYEEEVMDLLHTLFQKERSVIMCGGSMMYIDAVCKGIDDIPTVTPEVRSALLERYKANGLEPLAAELKLLDPGYWREVDRKNPKRVIHALEICYMTGRPYSTLRTGKEKERDFNIIKIGLTMPREELYERINRRVDQMVHDGLVEEAQRVRHLRHLNSLNTVGMKELFSWMDGATTPEGKPWTLEFAIEKIKQNSRIYSRKQMTWFKRDSGITWFNPQEFDSILNHINLNCHAD